MTEAEFEQRASQLIKPNEKEYFETLKKSVLPVNREVFLELLEFDNTVLATFRSCDLVRSISKQLGIAINDVIVVLPRFIHLYCTLTLNKIELGNKKALEEEYSLESVYKKTCEMMNDIR